MRTRKMTDRMLLEGLVSKYGVNKLTSVIDKMNEDYNMSLYYGKLTHDMIDEWTQEDPDLWDFIKLYCLKDNGAINIYQITDTYEKGLRKMTPKQMKAYLDEIELYYPIRRRLPENVQGAYVASNGYFCVDCEDDDYTEYSLTNIPLDKIR